MGLLTNKMNKLFLIFFFSILLIFPIFVNAEEECIFNYVKVDGNTICQRNCSESLIISKERNNIILTPKTDVTIKYYPTPQYNQQPTEKWVDNSLHIIQPITSNYGYYYWISIIGKSEKLVRLIVLSYDEYEAKCVKKQVDTQSQNETKPPLLPLEQENKTPSNESQKEYGSSKREVKTKWTFWNLLQFIYNNWEFIAIILFIFIVVLAVIIARSRGATWEQISLGFLRETSQIPIPEKSKIKKSKSKQKSKP